VITTPLSAPNVQTTISAAIATTPIFPELPAPLQALAFQRFFKTYYNSDIHRLPACILGITKVVAGFCLQNKNGFLDFYFGCFLNYSNYLINCIFPIY
jgi:hypothetical protein